MLKSLRGDAVDQSWQAQAIVRREAEQLALLELQRLQVASMCATQMLGMQSMMTKKHLFEFQMHERLQDTLYSDICPDGDGSLPFCGDFLQMAEGSAAEIDEHALSVVGRKLDSGSVSFLQEHLRGVPDVQVKESLSSGASVPAARSPSSKTPKTLRIARKKANAEQKKNRDAGIVGSWSKTLVTADPAVVDAGQPVVPQK